MPDITLEWQEYIEMVKLLGEARGMMCSNGSMPEFMQETVTDWEERYTNLFKCGSMFGEDNGN